MTVSLNEMFIQEYMLAKCTFIMIMCAALEGHYFEED